MPLYRAGGATPGGADKQTQFNDNGALGGVETISASPFILDADGNTRGSLANDLQRQRSNVAMVASGAKATISGGYNNTASGPYNTIGGGNGNNAAGSTNGFGNTISGGGYNVAGALGIDYATVGGGFSNDATATATFIGGGKANTASSNYSTVGGGQYNSVSTAGWGVISGGYNNGVTGKYAAILGGKDGTASNLYSTVLNGLDNTSSARYATVLNGELVTADKAGQIAFNAGDGATQVNFLIATASTYSTNTSNLEPGNTKMTIPVDTAWAFTAHIIAKEQGAGNAIEFFRKGIIMNNGGTTTIGTVDTIGTDRTIGSPGVWTVAITADNTNDALQIAGTGAGTYTQIKWVAKVDIAEVTY